MGDSIAIESRSHSAPNLFGCADVNQENVSAFGPARGSFVISIPTRRRSQKPPPVAAQEEGLMLRMERFKFDCPTAAGRDNIVLAHELLRSGSSGPLFDK